MHELGIDSYTVHAGYARDLRPARNGGYFVPDGPAGISKQSASDFMYQSLCLIVEHAVARGVKVGLENLFPMNDALDCSLLCTPSEIHQFLARTANDGNVGLLLDMGHLCISANFFWFDKDEFIRSLNEEYQRKIFGEEQVAEKYVADMKKKGFTDAQKYVDFVKSSLERYGK